MKLKFDIADKLQYIYFEITNLLRIFVSLLKFFLNFRSNFRAHNSLKNLSKGPAFIVILYSFTPFDNNFQSS